MIRQSFEPKSRIHRQVGPLFESDFNEVGGFPRLWSSVSNQSLWTDWTSILAQLMLDPVPNGKVGGLHENLGYRVGNHYRFPGDVFRFDYRASLVRRAVWQSICS